MTSPEETEHEPVRYSRPYHPAGGQNGTRGGYAARSTAPGHAPEPAHAGQWRQHYYLPVSDNGGCGWNSKRMLARKNSALGKTIGYMLKRCEALCFFLDMELCDWTLTGVRGPSDQWSWTL